MRQLTIDAKPAGITQNACDNLNMTSGKESGSIRLYSIAGQTHHEEMPGGKKSAFLQHTSPNDILEPIMRRGTFIFRLLPALSLSFVLEGCVILNPVGDAISNAYVNTLTYFNVYYNAKRAFDNAEADIRDAEKKAQASTTPGTQAASIPASAIKNLDLVIDKCSNILAYHSRSAFVDDALMMTGKAFYYKAEYSKAERKFLELITQYPGSSLNPEAQLWYAMSQEKLNENDQARTSASALIESSGKGGDRDIVARAYALLGLLSTKDGATAAAVESYRKSEEAADDDQLKADAWYKVGKLYFDDGQYESAVHALLQVDGYSDNVYQIFQSTLLATQAYRKLEHLDKALALENEMSQDYRFKDYLGPVMLERGTIMLSGKRYEEAVNIFQGLDTTYARTETGATADFELGKYYEQVAGDYQRARDYYRRATQVPATPILDQAAHKVAAFNLYFDDLKQIAMTDSVLLLATKIDTALMRSDTVAGAHTDTLTTARDSVTMARVTPKPKLNVDSLRAIEAKAASGLGELFYTDLANPDSAVYWLKFSLSQQYVESSAPRILYILSQLATTYPEKTRATATEYQGQIVKDFPKSYFAKQILHPEATDSTEQSSVDSAGIKYVAAEAMIEAGKNDEALDALNDIIARYPASPHAAKCRYALGWLYENRLGKMDSAAAEYKVLIAQYPATSFAKAVSQRQLDTLTVATAKTDTALSNPVVQTPKKETAQSGQGSGQLPRQDLSKPPGKLSRRARILQSQHTKPKERE